MMKTLVPVLSLLLVACSGGGGGGGGTSQNPFRAGVPIALTVMDPATNTELTSPWTVTAPLQCLTVRAVYKDDCGSLLSPEAQTSWALDSD